MFVYSLKASTLKFFGILIVSVMAMAALVIFVPQYQPTAANTLYMSSDTLNFSKIKTNDDRISFLSQFGWEVEPEAIEEQEVVIPEEFDNVFLGYNDIQRRQGLDLAKYKKKTVMRYTYKVTNYENWDGTVYATMLVYRGKVIGGDLCSAEQNGFIAGFDGNAVK